MDMFAVKLLLLKSIFSPRLLSTFSAKTLLQFFSIQVGEVLHFLTSTSIIESRDFRYHETNPSDFGGTKTTLVIAFHDIRRLEYLNAALLSVKKQILPFSEVILVDSSNGSYNFEFFTKENSRTEFRHVATSLKHPAEKRNLGVDLAKGEIVCFLDDDNILLPNHLIAIYTLFADCHSADLVYTSKINFSDNRITSIPRFRSFSYRNLIRGNLADSSTIAVRKSSTILPRWDSSLFHEDWAFLIDAYLMKLKICPIFQRTVLYRVHSNSRRKTDFIRVSARSWLKQFRPNLIDFKSW